MSMKVVVAINEVKSARTVEAWIAQHSWTPGTMFDLIVVVKPLKVASLVSVLPGPVVDQMVEHSIQTGRALVDEAIKLLKQSLPDCLFEGIIIEGFAEEEIVRYARETSAELVVLAAHEKHGLQKLAFGSVAAAVCRNAPCSVVLVRSLAAHA